MVFSMAERFGPSVENITISADSTGFGREALGLVGFFSDVIEYNSMVFVGVETEPYGKKLVHNAVYHALEAVVRCLALRPLLHREHEARRFSSAYQSPPIATGRMWSTS